MVPSSDVNKAYYEDAKEGVSDYWRKMAAPRHRVAMILQLLSERPPRKLCDLGCGGGQFLAEVHERFPDAQLAGVDLAVSRIKKNQAEHAGIQFYQMDLNTADLPPSELQGSCDTVVAMELIEHVENPALLLRSAAQLLQPRGRLILSTQSGPVRTTEKRVGHLRHFTKQEMEALLIGAGYRLVRVWNTGFPFHDLSKWYANLNPDASLGQFGDRAYGLREDLICLLLRGLFRLNSKSLGAQLFAMAERLG